MKMTTVRQTRSMGNDSILSSMEFNSTDDSLIKTPVNYYGLIYTTLLFVIGVPGNITVFFVYCKKLRKNSTTIFILALSVYDLVNCTATLPTEIVMLLNPFIFRVGPLCKMSRFTTYTCNSSAAVILAAVAVDRFKRVCRPHGKQITTIRAKRMAILALAVSISFTWPSLVIYGPRTVLINNVSQQICEIDDSHVLTVYPLIYYSYMCFSTCGIYFILLGSYICIVMKMVKRRKFTSLISSRSVSAKEVPDIHIERPSTNCQNTNVVQVTSVHSSTRSLNICCQTDESNVFQYEPASLAQKHNNKTASTGSLNICCRTDDSNIFQYEPASSQRKNVITENFSKEQHDIKPNIFLNVDGLISSPKIDVKEYSSTHVGECNDRQIDTKSNQMALSPNKKRIESTDTIGSKDKIDIKVDLSSKGGNNTLEPSSFFTRSDMSRLDFPSASHSQISVPSNRRESSPSVMENVTQNSENKKRHRKSILSYTQSHTGEVSQNGSSRSKMRPSKRSLRTHRLGKTTLMLLVVTMIYIASFLPFLAVVIQRSIKPVIPLRYKDEFDTIYEALYRSYLLNCAVNPVIYSFCNANFRKDCKAACRRRKLFIR